MIVSTGGENMFAINAETIIQLEGDPHAVIGAQMVAFTYSMRSPIKYG